MIFQADSRRIAFKFTLFFLGIISYFLSSISPSYAEQPAISAVLKPAAISANPEGSEFSVIITVPENHHAYIDRGDEGYYIPIAIAFENVSGKGGVELLKAPPGERDAEVGATVLRRKGEFLYRMKPAQEGEVRLSIQSQICNDETKVCYAPQTLALTLTVTAATKAKEPVLSGSVEKYPERRESALDITDWIGKKFEEQSKNIFVAFFLVLLAGLLSAATPCVYPMLPVTYAILTARGKGNRREGLLHSVAYFVGIVLTYFLLGYVAGVTGGVLNAVMQSPVTNILIALFFIFFSLAMFDVLSVSLFQELGEKVNAMTSGKSSYSATLLMGIAAGIIISPCVGPVVFAILLQVADRIADLTHELMAAGETITFMQKSIIAFKGSIVMAGFGIGLGIPFLLVGLLSNKMPRSGQWMVNVKYAMGILIMGVAYLYFLKGFQSAGADASLSKTLTFVVLAITGFGGLFHCHLQKHKGISSDRIKITTFALLLLIGGSMTVINLLSTKETNPRVADNERIEVEGNLSWHRNYEDALQEARDTGKPVFIDFFAYWCANCVAFGKLTTTDAVLNNALQEAVLLKIYDTDPVFEEFKKKEIYRELTIGLPFFVILKSDGSFFWKTTRYDGTEAFNKNIKAAGGE